MSGSTQRLDVTGLIHAALDTGCGTNATMWQQMGDALEGKSLPVALHPVLRALCSGEAKVVMTDVPRGKPS